MMPSPTLAPRSVSGHRVAALARRRFRRPLPPRQQILPNAPYDGRFTFVRMNYESTPDGYWYGGQPAWAHGYPVAEENLMRIMNEVSYLGAHDEAFNSIRFDDPELVQISDCVRHRARLVGDHRQRGRGASRLHAEGRIRHRRRLQGARLQGLRRRGRRGVPARGRLTAAAAGRASRR